MNSSRTVIGLIAAAGVCASAGAQTTRWLEANSGNWTELARWDNGLPVAGMDVEIAATGAAYTSTLSTEFSINDLLLNSLDAELLLASNGILNLGGTATLTSGTMRFNGGRVVGGTIDVGAGSSLEFSSSGGNILDGVQVLGDLNLTGSSATVRLRNGSDVSGMVNLSGGGRLGLEGDQTVNLTIASTGAQNTQVTLEGTNVSVTLGAGNSITGERMDIGSAFAIGGTRQLTNDGIVSADAANVNGVRFNSLASLTNNGVLESMNGGRLQVLASVQQFDNTGQINVGSGSRFDAASSNWTNTGTISVTDGLFVASGGFSTAGVGLNAGRITGDATSTLSLQAVIDNSGQTLRTDAFGGEMVFAGASLSGGMLETISGTYRFSSSGSNILEGVMVQGDLKSAFMALLLRESSQGLLRILWAPVAGEVTRDNVIPLVYKNLPFGCNSGPFLLLKSLRLLSKHLDEDLGDILNSSLYMDDLLYTGDDQSQLADRTLRLIDQLRDRGGFSLRKLRSNSFAGCSNTPGSP